MRNQEIMKQLKINLDLGMLILLISKNMALEIIEEEEDSRPVKQLQELPQVQSQKKY